MKPSLQKDQMIRVIKEGGRASEKIRICDYSPKYHLENSFDRLYSCQPGLLMERREDWLNTLVTSEGSLSGSESLLVAGSYSGEPTLSNIPRPYITVALNFSDSNSRRRLKVELHYDDEASISACGLKSLFPKSRGYSEERIKSYYFIHEVEKFLSRIQDVCSIPILAGIERVWVREEIREKTNFSSFEFIPVIPICPYLGEMEISPKFVVTGGSKWATPKLTEVTENNEEEGLFDFYFPSDPDEKKDFKSPSRACFSANDFLVFREIEGCDPEYLANLLYRARTSESISTWFDFLTPK